VIADNPRAADLYEREDSGLFWQSMIGPLSSALPTHTVSADPNEIVWRPVTASLNPERDESPSLNHCAVRASSGAFYDRRPTPPGSSEMDFPLRRR